MCCAVVQTSNIATCITSKPGESADINFSYFKMGKIIQQNNRDMVKTMTGKRKLRGISEAKISKAKVRDVNNNDTKTTDKSSTTVDRSTSRNSLTMASSGALSDGLENEEGNKEKKKRKAKWSPVPLNETGFVLTLFPRSTKGNGSAQEEDELEVKVELEVDMREMVLERCTEYHRGCVLEERQRVDVHVLLRPDKDRRVRKAGRQVKDKHCKEVHVHNNKGRRQLFIHHRLSKLITLKVRRLSTAPFKTSASTNTTDINNNSSTIISNRSRLKPDPVPTRSAPQNLNHALHTTNAPSEISPDMVSILINLQHRELTPEDYDLLLRLDERVAPKTVDNDVISGFKKDIVKAEDIEEVSHTENQDGFDICPICMEMYEVGQKRTHLPCKHFFHSECIRKWLENSSPNCPVDGLAVQS